MTKKLSHRLLLGAICGALLTSTAAVAGEEGPERPGGLTRDMAVKVALERFDAADTDGNGILERAEMRAAADAMHEGFRKRRMEHAGPQRRGGPDHAEKSLPESRPDVPEFQRPQVQPMPMPQVKPLAPAHDSAEPAVEDGAPDKPRKMTQERPRGGEKGKPGRHDRSGADRETRIDWLFDRFDTNEDGMISRDEMIAGGPSKSRP